MSGAASGGLTVSGRATSPSRHAHDRRVSALHDDRLWVCNWGAAEVLAITTDGASERVLDSPSGTPFSIDWLADGCLLLVDGGICSDAEGAVWYADVPNRNCVRVAEGGKVLNRIEVDRGCFACVLGGPDRTSLFIVAAHWRPEAMFEREPSGQVLVAPAPAPAAGWP